jgi:hypothetical protein
MARWRISFQESGMGESYPRKGRLSVGIYTDSQADSKPLAALRPKQSSAGYAEEQQPVLRGARPRSCL